MCSNTHEASFCKSRDVEREKARAFDVQSQSKQHLFQFSSNPFPQHPPTSSTSSIIHPSTGRPPRAAVLDLVPSSRSLARSTPTRRVNCFKSISIQQTALFAPTALPLLPSYPTRTARVRNPLLRAFSRVPRSRLPDSDVFVVPAQTDST